MTVDPQDVADALWPASRQLAHHIEQCSDCQFQASGFCVTGMVLKMAVLNEALADAGMIVAG